MIDLAKRTVLQRLHKLGCGVLKKQKHERYRRSADGGTISIFARSSDFSRLGRCQSQARCRHQRHPVDGSVSGTTWFAPMRQASDDRNPPGGLMRLSL